MYNVYKDKNIQIKKEKETLSTISRTYCIKGYGHKKKRKTKGE